MLIGPAPAARAQVAAQSTGGLRLVTPDGHADWVNAVAFSPDGRLVVTASRDNTARVWDVATGDEVTTFDMHTGPVNAAAFSPDGRWVVTASDDHTARVWEAATGSEVTTFEGHESLVKSATFSPDGRRVVSASWDGTARVWEAATGKQLTVLTRGQDTVVLGTGERRTVTWRMLSAAFSPDGRRIVTTSNDSKAHVWEVSTAKQVTVFKGHAPSFAGVVAAEFSPDGRWVVTASWDSTARVWEAATGREVTTFRGHTGWVLAAAFSPDGRWVVTGGSDHTARVWEAATGKEVRTIQGHNAFVTSAAFSPDGQRFVTGSTAGRARVWDVATGSQVAVFHGYTSLPKAVAYSPDGRLVATANSDHTTRVWDVANGAETVLRGHTDTVQVVAFSPDGRWVVTASDDWTARVWEAATGSKVTVLRGHTNPVHAAAFSPDGRWVVTGGWDNEARVWETATGNLLTTFRGHSGWVNCAGFSSDGRWVVTASDDHTVRVWEPATGKQVTVHRTDGLWRFAKVASFSPDGHWVVSGGGDGPAEVWEAATGKQVTTLGKQSAWIDGAAFSPDGRQVVTAGGDHTARVWDAITGNEVTLFRGHTNSVSSAAFSPDGRRVITASRDNTVRVWDAQTGAELLRRLSVDSSDWVVVAPDGRFDGTEGGIRWMHYARGFKIIALNAFFEQFYTPGLTGLILKGTPYSGPDIRHGFGLPPSVKFRNPRPGDTVATHVTVAVQATDEGAGVEDVRLYVNGGTTRGVGARVPGCPAGAVCFPVDLLPGSNTLEATAFSSAHIEAERARITVTVPGQKPSATLRVLAVGINRYQNPRYSLNYGHPDAKAFVDSLTTGWKGVFQHLALDTLYDTAATGLAIKLAFRRVAAAAQPQDVFVFYYAGHGVAETVGDSTRFYLVPTDVIQMSDPDQIAQVGVANLRQLFDAVPASKKVMLIDACQSGEALEAFGQGGRGATEEQAIARLARASGVFVMAAAGSDQVASEVDSLGHGVFTYAWLRAMAADSGGPREHLVGALASEVERTIPDLSRRYHAQPQYPIMFRNGQDFPLLVR